MPMKIVNVSNELKCESFSGIKDYIIISTISLTLLHDINYKPYFLKKELTRITIK